ncbi:MAG TPA: hypothetical protein VFK30_01310 [Anaerolineae bacterium]|nr:hypothetical protein [Anaerolineae bacterium]
MSKNYEAAAEQLREAMPADHVGFLQSLKTLYSHGKYFLCHAGVRPGIALDRQSDDDLLWTRDEFLSSTVDFGAWAHTPRSAGGPAKPHQYRCRRRRHWPADLCGAG